MSERSQDGALAQEITGTVKWFNVAKGYGFVARPDKPDALLHANCLVQSGFSAVSDGAKITCEIADNPDPSKGLVCVRVKSLELDPAREKKSLKWQGTARRNHPK